MLLPKHNNALTERRHDHPKFVVSDAQIAFDSAALVIVAYQRGVADFDRLIAVIFELIEHSLQKKAMRRDCLKSIAYLAASVYNLTKFIRDNTQIFGNEDKPYFTNLQRT